MNFLVKLISVFLIVTNCVFAQDLRKPTATNFPLFANQTSIDENLNWHRIITENFLILSLNKKDGEFIAKNVELIKEDFFKKWSYEDIELSKKDNVPTCMILCVPTDLILHKMFRVKSSYCEQNTIWISGEDKLLDNLKELVPCILLHQYEDRVNFKFNAWIIRSMISFNQPIEVVKNNLIDLKGEDVQKITNLTIEDFQKKSMDERQVFDNQAVCLHLMIRKEFGKKAFIHFLKNNSDYKALQFKDLNEFNKTYNRYIVNLSKDIKSKITPDEYLNVF